MDSDIEVQVVFGLIATILALVSIRVAYLNRSCTLNSEDQHSGMISELTKP